MQQTCQNVAIHLSESVEQMPQFALVSDGRDLPVFAFRLSEQATDYTAYDVSRKLREREPATVALPPTTRLVA